MFNRLKSPDNKCLFGAKNKKHDFWPDKSTLTLCLMVSLVPTVWHPYAPPRTTRKSYQKTNVRFVISMVKKPQKDGEVDKILTFTWSSNEKIYNLDILILEMETR